MGKAVEHTRSEFATVRTGRATPALVEKLPVDYYGTEVPLQQLAGFSVPEARTWWSTPTTQGAVGAVEKAIRNSDLGVNPSNDGAVIRLVFPPLTADRRKDFVKVVKHMAEEGRVAVRNLPGAPRGTILRRSSRRVTCPQTRSTGQPRSSTGSRRRLWRTSTLPSSTRSTSSWRAEAAPPRGAGRHDHRGDRWTRTSARSEASSRATTTPPGGHGRPEGQRRHRPRAAPGRRRGGRPRRGRHRGGGRDRGRRGARGPAPRPRRGRGGGPPPACSACPPTSRGRRPRRLVELRHLGPPLAGPAPAVGGRRTRSAPPVLDRRRRRRSRRGRPAPPALGRGHPPAGEAGGPGRTTRRRS